MDPLSITASLIAILQISGTIISSCCYYRASVKHALSDLEKLIDETIALRTVLEQLLALLHSQNRNAPGLLTTINLLNEPGGPIKNCKAE